MCYYKKYTALDTRLGKRLRNYHSENRGEVWY